VIEVRNLSFHYPGNNHQALDSLNFAVNKGEIIGFLGPSGAGKSTTQKILIGLLKGYRGQVTIFDKDLTAWGADYYQRIGVSFESPNHYRKLTALENLNFFRSLYSSETEEPKELLAMVGLAEDSNTRVAHFSKGMQMRLNFARALLNRPELVFLDEPTSGLDPINVRNIINIIRQLQEEGRTIFLTTHNMALADELCDQVAFIVDGQISLIDSPRELKIRYGQRIVKIEYQGEGKVEQQEFSLEGLGNNEEFYQLLRQKSIDTIHTQEATLEDIFIKVTGRNLR